jgi:hypothetical protein
MLGLSISICFLISPNKFFGNWNYGFRVLLLYKEFYLL